MHRDKENFVGKQALEGTNRTELLLSGVKVQDYAPEHDNRLLNDDGIVIGRITAGANVYSLRQGIAFVRLRKSLGYGCRFL